MTDESTEQLLLLPLPEPCEGAELLLPPDERARRYPLTTIDRDQVRLHGIIDELSRGRPKSWIARTYQVGHDTLMRIEVAHGPKIGELKNRLAGKMLYVVDLIVDQVAAAAAEGKLDPDKSMITGGIMVDKILLLRGEPSVIVGSLRDYSRFTVESLRARLGPIIDVTPTGFVAGDETQTRAREGAASEVAGALGEPARDNQSPHPAP